MHFTNDQIGPVLIIRWSGLTLDRLAAQESQADLLPLVAAASQVVLDLSHVRYVDWFGMELLLEAIRACPGKARVSGASGAIESLFLLHHLADVIELVPTVKGAIARALRESDAPAKAAGGG